MSEKRARGGADGLLKAMAARWCGAEGEGGGGHVHVEGEGGGGPDSTRSGGSIEDSSARGGDGLVNRGGRWGASDVARAADALAQVRGGTQCQRRGSREGGTVRARGRLKAAHGPGVQMNSNIFKFNSIVHKLI
jgi:hypothetical protein